MHIDRRSDRIVSQISDKLRVVACNRGLINLREDNNLRIGGFLNPIGSFLLICLGLRRSPAIKFAIITRKMSYLGFF